eukprot:1469219-Rhodomonas_salina.1
MQRARRASPRPRRRRGPSLSLQELRPPEAQRLTPRTSSMKSSLRGSESEPDSESAHCSAC